MLIRRLRDSHPDAVIEALRKPIHDMCHGLLSRRSMDLYLRFSSALRAAGIADQPTALAAPFGEFPLKEVEPRRPTARLISQTRVRLSTAVYLDTLGKRPTSRSTPQAGCLGPRTWLSVCASSGPPLRAP
ncbi:hypothetical protein Ddc_18829 [Ditylenchus destructor]|nr:hypothetical protein Ddc_18829 [Ditylenchus destructor]